MGSTPRYRAPQNDGEVFLHPSWRQLREQVHSRWTDSEARAGGNGDALQQLAREARREALAAAVRYTSSYVDVPPPHRDGPLVYTGHQPELVHPGVWIKNFATAELARQCAGNAIHLIIDGDPCRRPAIKVPTGTAAHPHVQSVFFDARAPAIPYEERQVLDEQAWHSFGSRVAGALAGWQRDPLLREWWPVVAVRDLRSIRLGQCLAEERHRIEIEHGCQLLQLPQSEMCKLPSFRTFFLQLAIDADRFREIYNAELATYRRRHKIRTSAQPVPDLTQRDGYLELPFWTWKTESPLRRRLFARPVAGSLQLTDFHNLDCEIALSGDNGNAVAAVARLEADGVKIRSRALTTTMFARFFLSDGFVHGIGGGMYDQVTDGVCRRFFGKAPPPLAVVSGTLRLGAGVVAHGQPSPRQIRQQLRDLRFHPERWIEFAAPDAGDRELEKALSAKQRAIEMVKTPATAASRHAAIVAANERLQSLLWAQRESLVCELGKAEQRARALRILESREYAFCLFSMDRLRDFLLAFVKNLA